MFNLINRRYVSLFLLLKKDYSKIIDLIKRTNLAAYVVSQTLTKWADEGLIKKEKSSGKEIKISLTDYGKAQLSLLEQILKNEENQKGGEDETENRE